LEIVSISGSQYGSYQHFLWYYSIWLKLETAI
jgi:hypothetical protein